jgi:hypothetical protein
MKDIRLLSIPIIKILLRGILDSSLACQLSDLSQTTQYTVYMTINFSTAVTFSSWQELHDYSPSIKGPSQYELHQRNN